MTDNVVQTLGLGYRFGREWAVRGLDMAVPRGSVYGLLGLNGAGKSTTLRMLLGLLTPHEGSAQVLGLDPSRAAVAVKARVGYVGDRPTFYDWLTVAETIALVARHRRGAWDDAYARHLVAFFSLRLDKRLGALSKGQVAKVALVLAMGFRPEVLILDEPTGGLDPVVRREFLEGLLSEYLEDGRTILISSHLITEISGLVDHVGILHKGAMLRQSPVEDLQRAVRRVVLTYDGEPPADTVLPGVLRRKRAGREVRLTVEGLDESRLGALGAASVRVEEIGLEDLFVDAVIGADGAGVAT
jgi:ABC-2 type transport system ATP-binding protein